mgnify:FL=1
MYKIKVGITTREEHSIWSNGLDQNIYFLYKMLEDMGYAPDLVSEDDRAIKLIDVPIRQLNLSNVKDYDIILEVAHPLSNKLTNYFNSSGKPLIAVKYGNNFMLDLEGFISSDPEKQKSTCGINLPFRNRELWISEQFYKFKDYLTTLNRAEVKVIPYIWDSMILRRFDDNFHLQKMFVEKEDFKKIAIVEPNINLLKNCIVPLAICNSAFLKDKNSIKEVYCLNSKHFEKNGTFMNYVKYLEIHNNKIATFENRHPLYKMFKENYANTIVSCQMLNEQNYVYAETIFYKRLLVHNSPLFKDVGVYYSEFDVNDGSSKLLDGIYNFDQEKSEESYHSKLEELSIYNPKNQEKVRELIESVIK